MEAFGTTVVFLVILNCLTKAQYLPPCADSEDSKFADCKRLTKSEGCEKHRHWKIKYCPLTCSLCTGPRRPGLSRASYQPKCNLTKFGCCKDKINKALGENGAGCPENCYDMKIFASQCKHYADGGYCKTHKERMLFRCPASCKFCKPIPKKPVCEDKWSEKLCRYLGKTMKYCDRKSWARRMSKFCAKSCGHCGIDAPDPEEIASQCARDGNCCWDKVTSPNNGCSRCYNLLSDDYCKTARTFCNDMVDIRGLKVRMFCPATCGMCMKSCSDHVIYQDYCKTWRYQGRCEALPNIMSQYCPRTCNLCARVKFG